MTHWKKAFKSDYLSSSDIEGNDLVLTIKFVKYQECLTQSGKKHCNVAHFEENGVKPMILNVGNSKIVKGFAQNKTQLEEWLNIKVQIYVDQKVRFGNDTVEGLRIRAFQPKAPKRLPPITDFEGAVSFLKGGKTIDDLKLLRSFDKETEDNLKAELS